MFSNQFTLVQIARILFDDDSISFYLFSTYRYLDSQVFIFKDSYKPESQQTLLRVFDDLCTADDTTVEAIKLAKFKEIVLQ